MLKFIERAQQAKIVDAADEAVAIVKSPGFTKYVPLFANVRFDVRAWADELARASAAARTTYGERESLDDFYKDEAREVRELSDRFEHWVRKLQAAARAIVATNHPFAPSAAVMFRVDNFEGGSTENIHFGAPALLHSVIRLGDLSEIGLPPSFIAEAKALYALFVPEKAEVAVSKFGRITATGTLHVHLGQIVELMDRFARYRAFAMIMSDQEIPEFGLEAIRSSLAGRPAAEPEPAGAAAPPVPPLSL